MATMYRTVSECAHLQRWQHFESSRAGVPVSILTGKELSRHGVRCRNARKRNKFRYVVAAASGGKGGSGRASDNSRGRKGADPPSRKELLLAARKRGDIQPIVQFSSDDFSVDRLLGTLDFMNVATTVGPTPSSSSSSSLPPSLTSSLNNPSASRDDTGAGFSADDVSRMAAGGQELARGGLQIRLYRGRIVMPGQRAGTRVIMKVYPSRGATSAPRDADSLAANELGTHVALQQLTDEDGDLVEGFEGGAATCECDNIAVLLGGFETATGEKWLVLRDDGYITAADYALQAAEATAQDRAVGSWEFWDMFDRRRALARREAFIRKVLRGLFRGLAFMHERGRLHQSLGPASIALNTVDEMAGKYVVVRLRDFAFSVDISDPSSLSPSLPLLSVGVLEEARANLWRRAAMAGATNMLSRRTYGVADDMYAAGLTVAFLSFVPLCQPGSIDGPALQRLLETTFQLDIKAAREYCSADESWQDAVQYLSDRDGAGWDLLQALLNPDYRLRPSAAAVLLHPFLAESWQPSAPSNPSSLDWAD